MLDFYKGRIATWWIPDDVVFIDELPHTATGKLSKKTLREQYRDFVLPTPDRNVEWVPRWRHDHGFCGGRAMMRARTLCTVGATVSRLSGLDRRCPRRQVDRMHEDRTLLLRQWRLETDDRRQGDTVPAASRRPTQGRQARRVHERPIVAIGGGNFNVNKEVAEAAKVAVEKRFGPDQVFVLNPGTADADIPNGGGADYMLMWTTLLEGPNGLGEDIDFVYFVGPQDFARYFGLDGNGDMAKIDQFYDKRISRRRLRKSGQGRPVEDHVSQLLRAQGVDGVQPGCARRVEYRPRCQRAASQRREARHRESAADIVRRPRRASRRFRVGGLGRLRRKCAL